MKRVAIIGQGYVGLPLAMAACESGFEVVGIDISDKRRENVKNRSSDLEGVDLDFLAKSLDSGVYSITGDFSLATSADVIVICVPTPLDASLAPDLKYLRHATEAIAQFIKPGALLINESTSFPGTLNEFIIPLIRDNSSVSIDKIHFAAAPERIDPNNKHWNIKNTPRVVSGIDIESSNAVSKFYKAFCTDVHVVSSPEVAEASKLLENSFRLVNIALVNQLVPFLRSQGISTREVIDAASTKPYGYMPFYPGAGVGGHCIPVDPLYLTWKGNLQGFTLSLIEEASKINRMAPAYVVNRVNEMLANAESPTVLVLGLSYKPGISDTRETPSKDIMSQLSSNDVRVLWRDPFVHEFEGFEEWNQVDRPDCAVLVVNQSDPIVEQLIALGVKILDCTGTLANDKAFHL